MTALPTPIELPDTAHCLTCGYALHGLVEPRCPECGRGFDPAQPSTYAQRKLERYERPWLGPPGWRTQGITAAVALVMLWAESVPGVLILPMLGAALALLLIGSVWGIWALGALYIALRRHRWYITRRWLWGWAKVPLGVVLLFVLLVSEVPLKVRLGLSLPWMNAFAERALADPSQVPKSAWIGLYHADWITVRNGVFRFSIRGSGFLESWGLEYAPAGPPASGHPDISYYHVLGKWYERCEEF